MSIGLIITAAGTSSRFDKNQNKLLTLIHETPLILHTLKVFKAVTEISHIVFTTHSESKAELEKLINSESCSIPYSIILGGETRQDSVKNAVQHLQNVSSIMIHDAARPCCSQDLINRLILTHRHHPAVIPGVKMTDTVKCVENGSVKTTLDRNSLYRIQTPQLFKKSLLEKAYNASKDIEATDEAMLIENINESVTVIDGDPQNIKLTTKNDLPLLNYYLS